MKIYTTTDKLLQDICDIFNTPIKLIKCKSREAQLVKVRHYYFYFAHYYYHFTLKCIGKEVGNRAHTTVINGRQRIMKLIEARDSIVLTDVNAIKQALEITDNLTLDYSGLIDLNKQLLERIKDLKKEAITLSHENLKLKYDLNYQKKLNISLYAK